MSKDKQINDKDLVERICVLVKRLNDDLREIGERGIDVEVSTPVRTGGPNSKRMKMIAVELSRTEKLL